ncbi:lactate transferase [Rhodovulum sp. PH10]|uniref:2-phospho-L-lactate transferase n=1 Tax=Rhodovulum sp. PH10 TaxID=1187851 RepID=UPI00027C2DA3|nr:2-phospho-L-lactate transferase [Rhodovulum sp. PH10]EJW11048.1 lactate transferase [Rhodovulum sp. PH10]
MKHRVLALAGGVGGAKLAAGLAHLLEDKLAVLVNTGDDFEHLGLHVSPDLDTVVYTLAGLANPATGWGLAGESWAFMEQVEKLGGETWFRLGDRDLATHAIRTDRLRRGERLSAVTAQFCQKLGIAATVLPMTDDRVRTVVHSGVDDMPFQDYFVRRKCAPEVTGLSFEGADEATIVAGLDAVLGAGVEGGIEAVIVCPSNPWLSIAPILALPGLRERIAATGAPVIAVSPIVGGKAIKGPAAKIMRELGTKPSALGVARHYAGFLDGFVIDRLDASQADDIAALGMTVRVAQTVMSTPSDRVALARECLAFAAALTAAKTGSDQVPR